MSTVPAAMSPACRRRWTPSAMCAAAGKPVSAVAHHWAASAAYWLASAADELVVTPSGEVGSIGVYVYHEDISKRLELLGVTPTLDQGRAEQGGRASGLPARRGRRGAPAGPRRRLLRHVRQGRRQGPQGVRSRPSASSSAAAGWSARKRRSALGMADRVGSLADTIKRMQRTTAKAARAPPPTALQCVAAGWRLPDFQRRHHEEPDGTTPAPGRAEAARQGAARPRETEKRDLTEAEEHEFIQLEADLAAVDIGIAAAEKEAERRRAFSFEGGATCRACPPAAASRSATIAPRSIPRAASHRIAEFAQAVCRASPGPQSHAIDRG